MDSLRTRGLVAERRRQQFCAETNPIDGRVDGSGRRPNAPDCILGLEGVGAIVLAAVARRRRLSGRVALG